MSETAVIATWTERPYTSHDKRHIRVEHRVRVLAYERFADVQHERRRRDKNKIIDDWKEVAVVELRDHGMNYRKVRGGVLQE